MMNINIHIFIAVYLILKYCIDGPTLVINYRNMKLLKILVGVFRRIVNNVSKHNGKHSIQFHSLKFIVLNILMAIGYIIEC